MRVTLLVILTGVVFFSCKTTDLELETDVLRLEGKLKREITPADPQYFVDYFYNKDLLVAKKIGYSEGSFDNPHLINDLVYENGKLSQIIQIVDGKEQYITDYIYENNLLVEILQKLHGSITHRWKYFYQNAQMTREEYYVGSTSLKAITLYYYDDQDRLLRREKYDGQNEYEGYYLYEYLQDTTRRISVGPDGTIGSRTLERVFDKQGNEIEIAVSDTLDNNELFRFVQVRYSYNSKNQKIKQEVWDMAWPSAPPYLKYFEYY